MDRKLIEIECPAKINLYLKVLGKRNDGFHQLETVFQAISLFDYLRWEDSQEWLTVTVSGGPDFGQDNLVRRAARLFETKTGHKLKGNLILEKKIPIGGGLGGGSSDAAGMLSLCRSMYPATPEEVLFSAAKELGSDVPFFLKGGMAWGQGRGEILSPCSWDLSCRDGFVIVPPFELSTAEVFAKLNASPFVQKRPIPSVPNVSEQEVGFNDLFGPACQSSPALKQFACSLSENLPGEKFFMTGSGSSFVWLTSCAQLPDSLREFLNENGGKAFPFSFLA